MNENGSTSTAGKRRGGAVSRVLLSAVAVLVLAFAASCGGASEGGGQQPADGDREKASSVDQALGREPLGEATAPVVLTEYADYQ